VPAPKRPPSEVKNPSPEKIQKQRTGGIAAFFQITASKKKLEEEKTVAGCFNNHAAQIKVV
jgi:hypothetical protein